MCERWAEYYKHLFAKDVSIQAANDIQDIEEDDPDITISEVANAMQPMKIRIMPVLNDIPVECIKNVDHNGVKCFQCLLNKI